MAAKKGWGSTVLGWFVVSEDDETGKDASFSGDNAGASDPAVPPPIAFVKDPPPSPGGKVQFDAVYEAAGIEAEEQARVVKAAELLRALPAGTEPAVQKQIVAASLKAFGVPVEKIIEAAVAEVQALEGYIRAGAADTQKVLDESRKRIAEFEQEIARIKAVMEDRVSEQQAVTKACNEKKLDIQSVLEFFGQEAVARVVRDSPKLIEPDASSR
jgi:hypothetical protein